MIQEIWSFSRDWNDWMEFHLPKFPLHWDWANSGESASVAMKSWNHLQSHHNEMVVSDQTSKPTKIAIQELRRWNVGNWMGDSLTSFQRLQTFSSWWGSRFPTLEGNCSQNITHIRTPSHFWSVLISFCRRTYTYSCKPAYQTWPILRLIPEHKCSCRHAQRWNYAEPSFSTPSS